MSAGRREARRLARRIRELGYRCDVAAGSGHYQVRDDDGRLLVVFSASPSRQNGLKRAASLLRRKGVGV